MARKSVLNPYAAPYVPLSEMFSGINLPAGNKATTEVLDDSKKKETTGIQVSNIFSAYNIEDPQEVGFSEDVASKMIEHAGASNVHAHDNEAIETEHYGVMNDHELIMETLSSMFPGISIDSIADLFHANHGDVSDTIDMLEQFEHDGIDFMDLPETSEMRNTVSSPPLEVGSSGTNKSV